MTKDECDVAEAAVATFKRLTEEVAELEKVQEKLCAEWHGVSVTKVQCYGMIQLPACLIPEVSRTVAACLVREIELRKKKLNDLKITNN